MGMWNPQLLAHHTLLLLSANMQDCQQDNQCEEPCSPAIIGKGIEATRLEVLHEELRTQIGSCTSQHHANADQQQGRGWLSNQLWHLQQRGCPNQRRPQQKGEAGRIFMGEAYPQPGVTTFFPPKIPAKAPMRSGTGLNEASSPVAEQQRKQ